LHSWLVLIFIWDLCQGSVARFTQEHCTEDLRAFIRTEVEQREVSTTRVAAAVYFAMLTRPSSFLYAADTEALIMEKVEVILEKARQESKGDAAVDALMKEMNERLVNQHFMVPAPTAPVGQMNRYVKNF